MLVLTQGVWRLRGLWRPLPASDSHHSTGWDLVATYKVIAAEATT